MLVHPLPPALARRPPASPASAALGYVLSRTTGLPNATGDIGNWTEPLGLASLFVEGSVIALVLGTLTAGLGPGPALTAR